jgi:hypothetical protein
VASEPTSAGRCGPKLQFMLQRVDAHPATCPDLELICGGTRSSGYFHKDCMLLGASAKQLPYLARQMLKWFYDTSTGAATGAARCGSFVGNGFSLLVVGYE